MLVDKIKINYYNGRDTDKFIGPIKIIKICGIIDFWHYNNGELITHDRIEEINSINLEKNEILEIQSVGKSAFLVLGVEK